jgi:hypothetical protein
MHKPLSCYNARDTAEERQWVRVRIKERRMKAKEKGLGKLALVWFLGIFGMGMLATIPYSEEPYYWGVVILCLIPSLLPALGFIIGGYIKYKSIRW